ncbi:MAG: PAS domain-containing protein [Flavobacteriales bacterium]|nr:PAS domain-containing protein [Flavobacteriales bacterium]
MSSQQIELILSRQLADSLSIPVFLVDTNGTLLFYNEPAEEILGMRYEETGSMPPEEWSTKFQPQSNDGKILDPSELPLVQTLKEKTPSHGEFWIKSMNGEMLKISVTSYPIIGRPSRFLGAVALFWKSSNT